MDRVVFHTGRLLAAVLLLGALDNLCLFAKVAISADETYAGKTHLIAPLLAMGLLLWATGCLLNAAMFRSAQPAIGRRDQRPQC